MNGTYAKVIADSVNVAGDRLTTMEVRFHRFVLAEFNTHRVFSRNSASSRAIPVAKQLARVTENPALPLSWPAEQKGMQGGAELSEYEIEGMRETWQRALEEAVDAASLLTEHGLHKSVANRLLEPFMYHTVVVTSTAWENFFGLRCSPMAQPEIRVAAEMMQEAYRSSFPQVKESEHDWHLPYMDWESADEAQYDPQVLVKISAARCARVTHLTHDGKREIGKDIELYNRLVSADPMHASPLEHVARPAPGNVQRPLIRDSFTLGEYGGDFLSPEPACLPASYAPRLPQYGNFLGWHQHRFDVEARKQYVAYS